jgi:hypothetical protein
MAYIPILDDPGKRVLRVIRSRGVVPGWQVMSEAQVSADQLLQSAHQLMSFDLISAEGNLSNPSEIGKAYFNILPSNVKLAELVLNVP